MGIRTGCYINVGKLLVSTEHAIVLPSTPEKWKKPDLPVAHPVLTLKEDPISNTKSINAWESECGRGCTEEESREQGPKTGRGRQRRLRR